MDTSEVLSLGITPGQLVCAGRPIPGTQIRVVDRDTGAELADGQQGLLLARGPGVMQGCDPREGVQYYLKT